MCTDLWHQILVVSKLLWVWSSEDLEYASFDFLQIDYNSAILYNNIDIFFALFLKRGRKVFGSTSAGGNLGKTSVGGNFATISSNLPKHRNILF